MDWHLDISTNKRFPPVYAGEINPHDAAFGNVRYVWEVNRFLFLPALALRYRLSAQPQELDCLTSLISSWVTANPYLLGINWQNLLEVNVRLINWFLCWNSIDASLLAKTNPVFQQFAESIWLPVIYQHCFYIRTALSNPVVASHQLIVGYAGLFIASSYWKFAEAADWNAFAKTGLEQEMQRQHSPNGLNRDESADDVQFKSDLFLIAYLTGLRTNNPFSALYTDQLENTFSSIVHLLDLRGNFPKYGDENSGRLWILDDQPSFNNFRSLLASAAVLFGNPIYKHYSDGFDLKNRLLFGDEGLRKFTAIPDSQAVLESQFYPTDGHYSFRKQENAQNEIYVHFKAVSMVSQPVASHSHADALSFVLHVDGQPFFVDSGAYTAETHSSWRRYFTSTRAHNTVCIDQQNQAVQDDQSRWLSPCTVQVEKAEINDHTDEVIASHDGYARLGCTHQRRMEFDKLNNRLRIDDRIENRRGGSHTVEVLFHLHPAVRFRSKGRNHFVLSHPQTKRLVVLVIDPALQIEVVNGQMNPVPLGWYSPELHQKQATCVFRAYLTLGGKNRVDLHHQITVQS
ncbi:alginate lyase family protein [Larkinella ripae]